MAFSLTWLPAVLEEADLKVAEVPGWQGRGRAEMGEVRGAMVHHTVGPRRGNMPSLNTLVNGRANLAGPLAQLGLGRDGTWYVIAAGRANHAGAGRWRDETDGNGHFIGIEAENTGGPDDMPWPPVQMDALRRGVAALLRHVGRSADWCMGHKEYAPGRKIDPLFDMASLRREIDAALVGAVAAPVLIPAVEPVAAGGTAGRPTLRRGSGGAFVQTLQERLELHPIDSLFGARTEAAVRAVQRDHGLVPDGIVGPKTWALIDRL